MFQHHPIENIEEYQGVEMSSQESLSCSSDYSGMSETTIVQLCLHNLTETQTLDEDDNKTPL